MNNTVESKPAETIMCETQQAIKKSRKRNRNKNKAKIEDVPSTSEAAVIDDNITEIDNLTNKWLEIIDCSVPVVLYKRYLKKMPRKYKFELDNFQKYAILGLEKGNNVLVSAHTSAGKSVIAEYAISLAIRSNKRAIYTAPIKALSNQKYRELSDIFNDVGLITGDISINRDAKCLIVTTEILKNMVQNNAKILEDLMYVIFDEVHYINDDKRGHVWEDIIISLQLECRLLMLSATIPNYSQFANWIGCTRQSKVSVVTTEKRPVPLTHYLYTGTTGNSINMHAIMNSERELSEEAVEKAINSFYICNGNIYDIDARGEEYDDNLLKYLLKFLEVSEKLPAVFFVLSITRCSTFIRTLAEIDFLTHKEKMKSDVIVQSFLEKLPESERHLSQVKLLQSSLAHGIGIHHSGIIPILKEMIETLFQNGLIKFVIATETFSVGINMPVKCVLFESIEKHDGTKKRLLLPSEYTQMSGRAGRRGIDDSGTAIIICTTAVPSYEQLKYVLTEEPDDLKSKFQMTYRTILNTLSSPNNSIENLLKKSFREFDVHGETGQFSIEVKRIEKKITDCEKIPKYKALYDFCHYMEKYFKELTDIMTLVIPLKRNHISFGTVIRLCYGKYAYQFGIVLEYSSDYNSYKVFVLKYNDDFYCMPYEYKNADLWYSIKGLFDDNVPISVCKPKPEFDIIDVEAKHIGDITPYKCELQTKTNSRNISNDNYNIEFLKMIMIKDLMRLSFNNENNELKYLNLKDNIGECYSQNLDKAYEMKKKIMTMKAKYNLNDLQKVFKKFDLILQHRYYKKMLDVNKMYLYPEIKNKIKILKKIGYIDEENVLSNKGLIAQKFVYNEILITEILYRNLLKDLNPIDIATLLISVAVEPKNIWPESKIPSHLYHRFELLEKINSEIISLQSDHGINVDNISMTRNLINETYMWASGNSFEDVMRNTKHTEGVLIYGFQKLSEVCTTIGSILEEFGSDTKIKENVDLATKYIKRGIAVSTIFTHQDINKIRGKLKKLKL